MSSTAVWPLPGVHALELGQLVGTAEPLTTVGTTVQLLYGRSPVCARWCILRCTICAKPFPHSAQWCGRSPVCVRWCVLSFELSAKPFPQSAQWCGRSPLCACWCLLRSQRYGRSPVCVPESAQRYACSPVCVRWLGYNWLENYVTIC
uniref:Uncharacterized protein n=1 Tax=Chelydra serpentina TaxID=8475 RepID=A0A8C3RT41_CHESE